VVVDQDPRQNLARHLRWLREKMKITQPLLAQALGGGRPLSVPLISSWESPSNPKIPPIPRLEAYATFFATERSVAEDPPRMLSPDELTEPERRTRDELLRELMRLRSQAMSAAPTSNASMDFEALSSGPWRFDDGKPITIVCAQLPPDFMKRMPYTDRDDPDFVELYTYADLDSLFELHGHLRAANPMSQVEYRTAERLQPDDYTTHLVSLGGVDWNRATRSLLSQLELPVRQVASWNSPGGAYFEVEENGGTAQHRPHLDEVQGRPILREDVALFARAVNPYNRLRTVSICNGMYASGCYGAARALTDARFRDRNAAYLEDRFADSETFCIVSRVKVEQGAALTPDWTIAANRLFEWSR
jgi:transcriptional regulator with XRE-family HTH domain